MFGVTGSSREGDLERSRALFGAAALLLCLIGPGWSPATADGHGPARILELLRQHDRLQGAESEVAAVRKEFDAAKSVWRPQFDLEIKTGLEEILNPDADDTELEFYEGNVVLQQRVFDFGRADAQIDSARRTLDGAELSARKIRQSLILEGLLALLDLDRARKVLVFARESEANIKAQTGIEEVLVERGYTPGIDVLQAKAQLARAQARRVKVTQKFRVAHNRFVSLFGQTPVTGEPVPAFPPELVQLGLEDALTRAQKNNLDIRLGRNAIEIARADATGLRADRFPELNLIGEYRNKHNASGILGTEEDKLIMLRLNYSLYDGSRRRNTQRAGDLRVTSAEKRLADTRRTQAEAVRNAYADLESSQDNTVFFRNQAELTYQFLQLAYKQRKLGERSLIDVLSNETNFFNARSDAVSVKISATEAAYRLLHLLGYLELNIVHWR